MFDQNLGRHPRPAVCLSNVCPRGNLLIPTIIITSITTLRCNSYHAIPTVVTTNLLKYRGRGKHGPDFRLAPLEESPVSYALRTSINRPGELIFMPYVGLEFNTVKDAKDVYNLYSWEVGFGICFGSFARNRVNKMRTMQKIVCERQVCT